MKKSVLVGSIFVSILLGIIVGVIVHAHNDNVLEKAMLEDVEKVNLLVESNIIQTTTAEEKTTPNTKIVYETLYTNCNHIETSTEEIKTEDVNKSKEDFENKYNDWEIKNFSDNEVDLYKEVEGICNKHYVVKETDGYITIYTLDSAGNLNLKEVTDVYCAYLPDEDLELLKSGIKVNGDNELARVISDYE